MKYRGLNSSEVKESQLKFGKNVITNTKKNGFLKLFLESLGDPIIKILLIVLAVKTVFLFQNFDWFETLGIVVAIALASLISTISEYGSEKSFEKMQEESSKIKTIVLRDGTLKEIDLDSVVVGDIVKLDSGAFIPADGVIIEGEITADESSFTGETKDVSKKKTDELYRGSVVLNGGCYMKVTEVGIGTKYGKIALELQSKNPDSPLKIRLRALASTISKIGTMGALLVMVSYLFSVIFIANSFNFSLIIETITTPRIIFGHLIYALTLGVTIIIVSVPEGLPMMVALVLSSNMKRMVKNNVLVRRMVGIETAGSLNTLFTDKTGTLTKGNLEVVGLVLAENKALKSIEEVENLSGIKKYILESMILNNESKLDDEGNILGGNITDKACLKFAKKYKSTAKIIEQKFFTSDDKYASVKIDDGSIHELIKGAPEVLLPKIRDAYDELGKKIYVSRESISNMISKYTNLGYRVILLADKSSEFYEALTFISLILLKDEISETAKEAIDMITDAQVQVVMITGDSLDTATNIGKEIGLIKDKNDVRLTSSDLARMSDDEIASIYPRLRIIARALPTDKSRLVKIGQSLNQVVGMTGDGVNDAPALKCADVGFAMGSGSEVSKEASDIVILDNDLLSIGKSILYGRTIFKSIRKFVIFQLTMNLCALTLSILGPFLNISTPITVMQMLWINMIMDTFAGLAFSFEPPLKEYMRNAPLKKDERILNKYMYSSILITGVYTAILLILFLKLPVLKNVFRYSPDDRYLMTAFFGLFVFSGVINSFNTRTDRINIFANITKNIPFIIIISLIIIIQIILLYFGGFTFRTFGLTLKEFSVMICFAATVLPVDILRKYLMKGKTKETF
ncbi:MAG TPA: calcium-translocating P-type ATPase, PMCA-type [Firmicutes bacterium]|nr:calcium-translocating P-type ATPase, PMCA-type [Bacillota bacterium]